MMKPCPWCKSAAVRASFVRISDEHQWHHVECGNCFAVGPHRKTPSDAILEWNRLHRLASTEGREGVEELRHKLMMIVSHATGGASQDIDASTNDICCEITRVRNTLYQAGKDAAASALRSSDGAGEPVVKVSCEEAAARIVREFRPDGWPDKEAEIARYLDKYVATPPAAQSAQTGAGASVVVKREISVPLDEWLELHRDIGFARGLLRGWLYSAGDTDRAAEATRAFLADAEGG